MKNRSNFHYLLHAIIGVFIFSICFQNLHSQNTKKNKLRISAQYTKITDGESYFDIKASSRVEKKNVNVSGIEISFFNEQEDGQIELGKITTNHNGVGKFIVQNKEIIKPDSTNTYHVLISFPGNELYTKALKRISYRDVKIDAEMILKDSINYISARLRDPVTDSAIVDTPLKIQVQRLFKPLIIGEEFNMTDEKGTIFVAIEEEIPGVDGNLTFEVVLDDSDDYGTVKTLVKAPIGIPIVDESTFDKRTMWSTRNKTPRFLLILSNILIVGFLGIIIYLLLNLLKIYKAKY